MLQGLGVLSRICAGCIGVVLHVASRYLNPFFKYWRHFEKQGVILHKALSQNKAMQDSARRSLDTSQWVILTQHYQGSDVDTPQAEFKEPWNWLPAPLPPASPK